LATEGVEKKEKVWEEKIEGELLDVPRIKNPENMYKGLSEEEVEELKEQNKEIEEAAAKGDKDAIEAIEFANKMNARNSSEKADSDEFGVQASAPKIDEYIRIDNWEITEYNDIMVWYTVKKPIPNQYHNFS